MNYTYLVKALRAYRVVTYGQFDQSDEHTVQETQDAADAIEDLTRQKEKLLTDIQNITSRFVIGEKTVADFDSVLESLEKIVKDSH